MGQGFSIETVLEVFVEDQRYRVSARTIQKYENIISLLRHSLNGYGYQLLDVPDVKCFATAFEARHEEAFWYLFGPECPRPHRGVPGPKGDGQPRVTALVGNGHKETRWVAV
jgi:hypothetical protein